MNGPKRKPSDEDVRERVRRGLDVTYVVDAGAGTGKTTLLLDRLLVLLVEGQVPLSRVAAVTFTEKAAGELVEKLRKRLRRCALLPESDPALFRNLLDEMDRAEVGTFHSFCARILREYPIEARVDPCFRTLDEVEQRLAESEAWETWLGRTLEKGLEGSNRPLARALGLGVSLNQVADLKDFILGHRNLMSPFEEPKEIEAGPFRASVQEALQKVEAVLPMCRCPEEDAFTAVFLDFQSRWKEAAERTGEDFLLATAGWEIPGVDRKGRAPDWKDGSLAVVRAAFKDLGPLFEAHSGAVGDWACRGLLQWLRDYLEDWRNTRDERGILTFDDLLGKTRDLLKDHPGARRALRRKWDRLFVDEFQDTDPLQAEILFYLASHEGSDEQKDWRDLPLVPGKLFLVGDPQQSIYRFRRADVDLYGEVKQRVAQSPGGRVEQLKENFRTVKSVVDFVGEKFTPLASAVPFAAQNAARILPRPKDAVPPLVGLQIPAPPSGVKWKAGQKRLEEAKAVAVFLRDRLLGGSWTIEDPLKPGTFRGIKPGDVALLLRDLQCHEDPYQEALREADLPFQLVKGRRFFSRPEVAALVALLTALESPAEPAACVATLRSMAFGFTDEELFLYRSGGGEFRYLSETPSGKGTLDRLGRAFTLLKGLHEKSRRTSLPETLSAILRETGLLAILLAQPQGDQRTANLMKLSDQARILESQRPLSFGAFVRWIRQMIEEEVSEVEASPAGESREDRLTLMTIHQAKGLEFPVVVMTGTTADLTRPAKGFFFKRGKGRVEWKAGNLVTSGYETEKSREEIQQAAEGTRLLYVAATRARDCLVLPFAQWTTDGKFFHAIAPVPDEPKGPEGFHHVPAPEEASFTREKPGAGCDRAAEWDQPEVSRREEEIEKHFSSRRERHQSRVRPLIRLRASDMEETGEGPEKGKQGGGDGPGGKDLGTLAHRLMERAWDWDKELLVKAAHSWGRMLGLPEAGVREALSWVSRAVASGLGRRLARSRKVLREVPVSFFEGGVLREGVADVLFEEDGEWVLVDYKSDRDPAALAAHYAAQLNFYARLLEATTGRKVKEARLLYLRTGEDREVPLA